LSARPTGAGWYVAAGALALAGIGGAVALAVSAFASLGAAARFAVPGEGVVEVAAPGRQIVWHEYRSLLEGRTYSAEPEFPGGAQFTILAPDGGRLALAAAGQQTWNEGELKRSAVGEFEATSAGRYVVRVKGDFEPRVIAVASDFTGRLLASIGGALMLGLLGVGGGIGMVAYALGRRADAQQAEPGGGAPSAGGPAESAPPPAAGPEARLREMVTLVYALQAAALLTGITLVGGVVIDYLCRDEAAGTWLESHIRWQIRTFWWVLGWSVLGALTLVVLIGIVILLAAALWFVYRVAKGWVALRAERPVG
jgi:uncharacterized membrane protein